MSLKKFRDYLNTLRKEDRYIYIDQDGNFYYGNYFECLFQLDKKYKFMNDMLNENLETFNRYVNESQRAGNNEELLYRVFFYYLNSHDFFLESYNLSLDLIESPNED